MSPSGHVAAFVIFNYLYFFFIRFRVLGVFMSYFIRFRILSYKYLLITSKKISCC
jgi:hypothetical protein